MGTGGYDVVVSSYNSGMDRLAQVAFRVTGNGCAAGSSDLDYAWT